ncbi:hypothetical protein QWJ34_26330 [Saccharibacillus sp. CPCC 101409]|uniref:hypothetical protein n=1 Tax=Saccharibacillus sp. CPCC 101409 TaxID=3058041 RepID=UPI002672C0EF|nr:hypothetical protein [Saccharibacillus sp. CPCC 101409]MDO3413297.1 hypothetical protein [Saccharibacillus sp. CPCC 101409]
MNLFAYELKKIWNWRIVTVIAVFAALIFAALMNEALRSYDSLSTQGIYGSYQNEMFERYGDTLEPEELADYDIPGKKEAVIAELDEIIAADFLFAKSNIHNYAEFEAFEESHTENMSEAERQAFHETVFQMRENLSPNRAAQTTNEFHASPRYRLQTLIALENTYVNYAQHLQPYIEHDERPVVVRVATKILQTHNTSLIRYDLLSSFSVYVAVVGVFSTAASILLVAPMLVTDRIRKLNMIQYSSTTGRRMLKIQLLAAAASVFGLSAFLLAIAYIPFIAVRAGDYWNTPILSFSGYDLLLYDITFGQYALILAGMILVLNVGAACFTFVLARFSSSMITMLVKTVPVGIALASLSALSIAMAFSYNNLIFTMFFRGKISMPEVLVCAAAAAAGVLMAFAVVRRERRVDVL